MHAPFDGVVGLRFVSEGSYVTPSTRIATFQYTGKMKLDFSLPERFGATVAPGQLVQFTVVGIERTFEASIYAVEPRIDEVTRTLTVRAVLENHDYSLRPGAFARVRWTAEAEQSAIFIPSVALLPATDGDAVFIVRDGVVARRAVVSGPRSAEQIRILSGLNQGDEVIIAGVQQVRPGMLVVKINN
ncbi:MAG: efflux RND transporter periplasmic adaptor subunit [Verrucomicrobia bacterium]|nr:efflux RND transporter periplasmic adaptor subunit [Verrucomicrobiota bacterium]